MDNQRPLVSICCLTFNHAPFIAECLDGFLMQQTSFPVEILIHDDASTDGTAEIVKSYAEKHPGLIFPLFEQENMYSQGFASKMDLFNYRRAKGKYIAYCEGDDYWTDPLKLQKQVDFLEAHPEYSCCFTRYKRVNSQTDEVIDDNCYRLFFNGGDADVSLQDYFEQWVTQALTLVFRKDSYSDKWRNRYRYYRDFHEYYHLLKAGKCRLMNFYSGVYRLSGKGVFTSLNNQEQDLTTLLVFQDLWNGTHDSVVRKPFAKAIEYYITTQKADKKAKLNLWKWTFIHFRLTNNVKKLVKNLLRTI